MSPQTARNYAVAFILVAVYFSLDGGKANAVEFSNDERDIIASHGPWPPKRQPDVSNRVSGDLDAIRLGETLFSDARLSSRGDISCASCHDPARAFTDGRALAQGRVELARNTPTVLDSRFGRWFGWGGSTDTLWGASIRPILEPKEMDATAAHVAELLGTDPKYSRLFKVAFDSSPWSLTADEVLVNAGKAIAAFQETLVSAPTPFDAFRETLMSGDAEGMAHYPKTAQRGLKIFVGKGNCSVCHLGPAFTNGEFDDAGVPYFTGPGQVDKGRFGGIEAFRKSPYSRAGRYSDAPRDAASTLTQRVTQQHKNWGAFKVPGLRNISRTAPYMHNGSLATLRDVVIHYSEINVERLHSDGTAILRPLHLTNKEVDDLVAFLNSLTSRE